MSSQRPARTVSLVKDPSGSPAVNLTKHRALHVDLAKRADKAGLALSAIDLAGIRAQVQVYIDHSGSMEFPQCKYYTHGTVQLMVERALGFGLQVDPDGEIPVTTFDSRLGRTVKVNIGNYRDVVNKKLWNPRSMGGTSYAPVLDDILKSAKKTNAPILAVIVTDGNPSDGALVRQRVCELSRYPAWIKFLAIEEVSYLDELDNLEKTHPGARFIDNVDTKFFNGLPDEDGVVWPRIKDISDMQFAQAMADEWNSWIAAATRAGILR